MKTSGFIMLLFALLVSFAVFFMNTEKKDTEEPALTVEAIFAASGQPLNEDLQKEINSYRELFASQGFMALYREVYRISLDQQRYSFARQLAAVATLLEISNSEIDAGPLQSSGKRLFIHFCRLSILDSQFALKVARNAQKLTTFSIDPVLEELWNDYLRQVWTKIVLPEVTFRRRLEGDNAEFAELLPEFKADFEQIGKGGNKKSRSRMDFFLKPGKTGENESDYELREVPVGQVLE